MTKTRTLFGDMWAGLAAAAYVETYNVAPSATLTVVAAIRISIPSRSVRIACTVPR